MAPARAGGSSTRVPATRRISSSSITKDSAYPNDTAAATQTRSFVTSSTTPVATNPATVATALRNGGQT